MTGATVEVPRQRRDGTWVTVQATEITVDEAVLISGSSREEIETRITDGHLRVIQRRRGGRIIITANAWHEHYDAMYAEVAS